MVVVSMVHSPLNDPNMCTLIRSVYGNYGAVLCFSGCGTGRPTYGLWFGNMRLMHVLARAGAGKALHNYLTFPRPRPY